MQLRKYIPLVLVLAFVLAFTGTLVRLLTDSWWFASVGFEQVFWTRVGWQVGIWAVTFTVYTAFLWGNYLLAQRITHDHPYVYLEKYVEQGNPTVLRGLPRYGAIALILLLAISAALRSAAAWETVLKFFNPVPFNTADPIFQRDISFFVFRLPFLHDLQDGLLGLLVWSAFLALGVYVLKGEIRPERGWKYFLTGEAKTHLCLLLAGVALLFGAGFWLARFDLLYSPTGVVFGAGYTDVHARLQAYWMMGFVTLAVAVLFVLSLWRSGFSLPSFAIVIYLAVLILVNGLYPLVQQTVVVGPNELEKERPYIAYNIEYTRRAYNLQQVQVEPFPAEEMLDREILQGSQPTLQNIRLWDNEPLLSTYRQIQEIRLYYRFSDVDVDRYRLRNDYRQVMLAARELAYSQVPEEAQTWVNQRLKFTHGFGLAMSPVNQVTPDGLPELWIKNVPPVTSVDLEIDQPRIYYGEENDHYIFTGTSTDEFDYPLDDENASFRYSGVGGVPIGSLLQRLTYAYDLVNLQLIFSNYFTPETRIHYYRTIKDRVRQVAPFLTFDSDPYIALIDGRLQWIVDAYTVSDHYPYSEPLSRSPEAEVVLQSSTLSDLVRRDTNYLRNSVKVVVDAYDGTLRFFAIDEQDPVLASYRRMFPSLFESAAAIPATIRDHLRYPPDLFTAQAQVYRTYHMANPEVFYNREDLWRFPNQVYEGNQVMMQPYYLIMRLPDFNQEEFVQIMPFTPANRDNMVSWMAGRSDGENYGKLLLYDFPRQELVYGPSQIEARIDQTPEISEQVSLWSQQGSRVIRGDLRVIPIGTSLLYVEPLYLRAEQGELPELRRVILAYGDRIVMRETLEDALDAIFGEGVGNVVADSSPPETSPTGPSLPGNYSALIQSALEAYQNSEEALQQGNWQAYGESQRQLGEILQQLQQP
ncbi:MAG: UPF0182 family protein [Cyanobacteria bacterium Co-bin8]|nr:UPF0182 family protein [Cyanobacteria bacterium Co-bin8]